ncbi:hypothetical protein RhiirA1_532482 [Rhizophagus irregularis]|uniref:Uncharacterized protein n=3 Tax=Rhizophagus irregularis TaxID=588596 RepID=A0A2I1EHE6_9GLOM|nr:hypothetical protein RhiirA1_532482 [Rhizophagus irregularis]PKY21555.1 hypothetical protein RhiirB3_525110 [Rhizophagus irregularis]
MLKLNKDVIFLILEELQDDNKSLYSCLLVNRTWCETTVPILWKNPARQYYSTNNAYNILLNVILLHLSEESRNNLKYQGINLFMKPYQRPLFNYISFWRHLDLFFLEHMINVFDTYTVKSKIFIIEDEIFKLFINGNTNFVSLFIPKLLNPRIFNILGNEHCFSGLEYFYCDDNTNSNILERLAKISTSIEKLRVDIRYNDVDNPGIVELIEGQKNLRDVKLIYNNSYLNNESYRKSLEESLIKCADTIQYLRIDWNPVTNFLSTLVNLVSLDLNLRLTHLLLETNCHLEKVSLPVLKILRAQQVPPKVLASLIESTKGHLIEISILHQSGDDGKLIRTICKYCPNLCYLKLSIFTKSLSEFENLLISCQFLNELEIIGSYNNINNFNFNELFNWDKLFSILTKSSPISLFKFKFFSAWKIESESIRLFLDNWRDRYPMLLQLFLTKNKNMEQLHQQQHQKLEDIIEHYKKIGVIKKYYIDEVLIF